MLVIRDAGVAGRGLGPRRIISLWMQDPRGRRDDSMEDAQVGNGRASRLKEDEVIQSIDC